MRRLVFTVTAFLFGCHANDDGFYDKVYGCDPTSVQDPCGTTKAGRPMVCYRGDQLGGQNFCTEACDPRAGTSAPGSLCTSSGALLRTCSTRENESDPALTCPPGLACYRIDLLFDRGVCLDMRVCTEDSECASSSRTTCGATLVRSFVPPSAPVHADHLGCVQATCASTSTECATGESCLSRVYSPSSTLPDLCVPDCDASLHCPPGYACARNASAPGNAKICLPGLTGSRCEQDLDCMLGGCFDTGAGFSICTLPCSSDSFCAALNAPGYNFFCVEGVPGRGSHCAGGSTFQGSACITSADCADGLDCFEFSPYIGREPHGECRLPCDAAGRCPARGGLPHVCLAAGLGGCYPGYFGLPCQSSEECLRGLDCRPIVADTRYAGVTSVCTIPCSADADCDANSLTRKGGYCSQLDGFCHLAGNPGVPCSRDAECLSDRCQMDAHGALNCVDLSGGI